MPSYWYSEILKPGINSWSKNSIPKEIKETIRKEVRKFSLIVRKPSITEDKNTPNESIPKEEIIYMGLVGIVIPIYMVRTKYADSIY